MGHESVSWIQKEKKNSRLVGLVSMSQLSILTGAARPGLEVSLLGSPLFRAWQYSLCPLIQGLVSDQLGILLTCGGKIGKTASF